MVCTWASSLSMRLVAPAAAVCLLLFFFVSLLVCVYGFGRTRRSSDTKRHWLTFLQKRNVDGNGCFGGGMEGNRNKNPSVRERGESVRWRELFRHPPSLMTLQFVSGWALSSMNHLVSHFFLAVIQSRLAAVRWLGSAPRPSFVSSEVDDCYSS